jgi:hypothetical protein
LIGFVRAGSRFDGPVEELPLAHSIETVAKDAGLGVEGFENVALLETRCGASIFLDLKIVNHDPRSLRLFAGNGANRG